MSHPSPLLGNEEEHAYQCVVSSCSASASEMLLCSQRLPTSGLCCGMEPWKQVVGITQQTALKPTSALRSLSFEWERLWLRSWCIEGNELS